MNKQLSEFTRFLYGEHYRQGRGSTLLSIRPIDDSSHSYVLGSLLEPYSSLYTLIVGSPSSLSTLNQDIDLESKLVLAIINELLERVSLSSIFIITPHRMQRAAIRQRLEKVSLPNTYIICDTVERMQGKEAQCVLLCMLYRQREMLDTELEFIYNLQRINVGITRAKQLCILLVSQLVLSQPPLGAFVNSSARHACTLLGDFVSKSTVRQLDGDGSIK